MRALSISLNVLTCISAGLCSVPSLFEGELLSLLYDHPHENSSANSLLNEHDPLSEACTFLNSVNERLLDLWPERSPEAIKGEAMYCLASIVKEVKNARYIFSGMLFGRISAPEMIEKIKSLRAICGDNPDVGQKLECILCALSFEASRLKLFESLSLCKPPVMSNTECLPTYNDVKRARIAIAVRRRYELLSALLKQDGFLGLPRDCIQAIIQLQEFEMLHTDVRILRELRIDYGERMVKADAVKTTILSFKAFEGYLVTSRKAMAGSNVCFKILKSSIDKLWKLDANLPPISLDELDSYVEPSKNDLLLRIMCLSLGTLFTMEKVYWSSQAVPILPPRTATSQLSRGSSIMYTDLTNKFSFEDYRELLKSAENLGPECKVDPLDERLSRLREELGLVAYLAEILSNSQCCISKEPCNSVVSDLVKHILEACQLSCRILRGFLLYGKAGGPPQLLVALYHYSLLLPRVATIYLFYRQANSLFYVKPKKISFPYVWEIIPRENLASRSLAGFITYLLKQNVDGEHRAHVSNGAACPIHTAENPNFGLYLKQEVCKVSLSKRTRSTEETDSAEHPDRKRKALTRHGFNAVALPSAKSEKFERNSSNRPSDSSESGKVEIETRSKAPRSVGYMPLPYEGFGDGGQSLQDISPENDKLPFIDLSKEEPLTWP